MAPEFKGLDGMKLEFVYHKECGYTVLANGVVFLECLNEWELRHFDLVEIMKVYNELHEDADHGVPGGAYYLPGIENANEDCDRNADNYDGEEPPFM